MSRRLSFLFALLLALALTACGGAGTGTEVLPFPGDPGGGGEPPGTEPPAPTTSMSDAELALAQEVLVLLNQERAAVGLADLEWHDGADEVAYAHCVDMDVRDFFDHTNPDGQAPWDRLNAAGIPWRSAGENIAWNYPTAAAVMEGWMNSPGHRDNILRENFTHVGIGVHQSASKGAYWTQLFVTP